MSNQPTQPPKSAEECLQLFFVLQPDYSEQIIDAMEFYAGQFKPRYVTDEEIDAMWPDNLEDTYVLYKVEREAAKAMRDMIFNNVKPKV